MKKSILLSISVVLVCVIIISEIVQAQGKSDKGPLGKIVFIHYKKPRGRPENPGKKPKPNPDEEGSYTYIAKGFKWITTEDFIINTDGAPSGVDVVAAVSDAMDTWEDAAGNYDIFGDVDPGNNSVYLDDIDYKNVIEFSELDNDNIIAVTYVWGYFTGPPGLRQIVEVDMIFNTGSDWEWGDATGDNTLMDVLNIATHEIGHAAGMGDLYNTTDDQETMYGFSSEGEIIKRDLYLGDIAGIQNLY